MKKIFIALFCCVSVVGCKKKGCTDPFATNYDSTAKKDDLSCYYNITSYAGAGVSDIDGNTYTSVVLGNGQEWMAENLKTTKYANGDPIPNVPDGSWNSLNTGAYCWYDNDNNYENPYGKLYNFYAVDDSRNVCPTGWHVPTNSEWDSLAGYTGNSGYSTNIARLKSTSLWDDDTTCCNWCCGTNESGFNAFPGGRRNVQLGYRSLNTSAYFWLSNSYIAGFSIDLHGHYLNPTDSRAGKYIRCIKD